MPSSIIKWALAIVLHLLFVSPATANGSEQLYDVSYWQMFDQQNLDLEEVIGTPNANWQPIKDGHTQSTLLSPHYWDASKGINLWIKVELPRIVDSDRIWIELLPNVGLRAKMAIYENGIWTWKQAVGKQGSELPDFPANFVTFAINNPREHRIAFIKVNTSQVLHFSVNTKSDSKQLSDVASRNLFNGIVFGLALLAFIYNMVIGVSANEKVYIYYASYVLCLVLYMLSMTGYTRLAFPEWGGEGSFSNLSVLLVLLAATFFVRELLSTRATLPKFDLLLRLKTTALSLSIFLLGFVSDTTAYACAEILGLISPFILFITGVLALKNKHPMAKFFLIAWTCYIATGAMWAWMWLGYVAPTYETLAAFMAGIITEIVMLSILLGHQYSNLKKQTINLSKKNVHYKNESETDHLTGLYNKQGLYSQIEGLLHTSEKDLIWIDIDIDDFADLNKKHGVHLGDILLSELGQLLSTKVRRDNLASKLIDKENSYAYRRGVAGHVDSGHFTILLSNCSLPQARLYVERLMRDIEAIKIKKADRAWLSATASVGVIQVLPQEDFHSAWLRAGQKLDQAKNRGQSQLAFP